VDAIRHLGLEKRDVNAGNDLDHSLHLNGKVVGERHVSQGFRVETGTAPEQGVLDRDLDGLTLYKLVGNGYRVVKRSDLLDDGHLAVLVEINEGIDCRGIAIMNALVGDLKGPDILQLLDADLLSLQLFRVESRRLHYAGGKEIRQKDNDNRENRVGQDFVKRAHTIYSDF